MYPKWRGFCGIVTLTASLAILGCGSTSTTNVRAVNASQGFAPFTFQVGQIGIASGLAYGMEGVQPKGQYSTTDSTGAYREVGAGTNQSVITYTTPGSTPLATVKLTLASNTSYTIVSLGTAPGMSLIALTDNGAAPASGQYGLRFLNTASIGPVDIYITAVGAAPSGSPTISNVSFNASPSYGSYPPGTLEMQITAHGSTQVLAQTAFSPAGGNNYSAFFFNPPAGSSTYTVISVPDAIGTSKS